MSCSITISQTFIDRLYRPKAQPKSAATTKTKAASAAAAGKNPRPRKARNARPAKKTAEELDSEMADYWESGANATGTEASGAATNGAAQPATNGDAAMDDEILVCRLPMFIETLTNQVLVNGSH